jgi:hypothetical protein
MQALEIYKGQMVNRMAGLDYKSRRVQRLTDVLSRAGSPGWSREAAWTVLLVAKLEVFNMLDEAEGRQVERLADVAAEIVNGPVQASTVEPQLMSIVHTLLAFRVIELRRFMAEVTALEPAAVQRVKRRKGTVIGRLAAEALSQKKAMTFSGTMVPLASLRTAGELMQVAKVPTGAIDQPKINPLPMPTPEVRSEDRGSPPGLLLTDPVERRGPDRSGSPESWATLPNRSSAGVIVDAILAVGRQRKALLGQVRSALLAGKETEALRLTHQLCGLPE